MKALEIKFTNSLLDQQIRAPEKAFVEHGGVQEAMTAARRAYLRNPDSPDKR